MMKAIVSDDSNFSYFLNLSLEIKKRSENIQMNEDSHVYTFSSQDMLFTYIFYKLTCLTCFLKCHFNFYPSLPLIALLSPLCIFSESHSPTNK